MSTPIIYYKNVLKIAEDGHRNLAGQIVHPGGDGTIYAYGSSADPQPDNKRFTLNSPTFIADLGADADDKLNGYILYFPASGNKYNVVDWEATPNYATTFETPDLNDTGAWEIRLSLYEKTHDPTTPAFYLVDGIPSKKYKENAVNQAISLYILLPNFVDQGGFEELAAGDFSAGFPVNKWGVGGATPSGANEWKITATSPILGSRMATVTSGGSDRFFYQRLAGKKFEKGKKYRVIVKASSIGAAPSANPLRFAIYNHSTGNALDTDWDSGSTWLIGQPDGLSTTAAWFISPQLIPEYSTDKARLQVWCDDSELGSATGLNVDEIYIWEEMNPVNALIFNHNFSNSTGTLQINGYFCPLERTGFTGGVDSESIASQVEVDDSGPILLEGTQSHPWPIYRVQITADSAIQYEAGQILLCEKWEFEQYCFLPHTLEEREVEESSNITKGGVRQTVQNYEPITVENRVVQISATEKAKWDEWRRYHHSPPNGKQPFVFRYSDSEGLYLMESDMNRFAPTRTLMGWDVDFKFREVL